MSQNRIRKGPDASQGRTSVPGDQAPVWLYESALSRADEKHRTTDHAICPVEPVDDAKTAVGCGRGAPMMREMRGEKVLLKEKQ